MNKWNIKYVYPMGGHLVRTVNGDLVSFVDKQKAVDACEMYNADRKDRTASYIVVPEDFTHSSVYDK